MTQTMSIEEYNQWRNRGKRNKYHVADPDKRKWRGKTYASKGEMEYAQNLIEQMNAGNIVEIVEQPRIRLGPDSVYVPDFLIMPTSGFPYFADFKGVERVAESVPGLRLVQDDLFHRLDDLILADAIRQLVGNQRSDVGIGFVKLHVERCEVNGQP